MVRVKLKTSESFRWVFPSRLMGLMLTAIAFQFFVSALVDLRVIAPIALP